MSATRVRSGSSRSRRPARRRLAVEFLEGRDVPSSVTGVVFQDDNANGLHEGAEPGLAGWTAFVDSNRNNVLDPGEVSAVTDASGTCVFDTTNGPSSGIIAVVLPTGSGGRWLNTTAMFDTFDTTNNIRSFGAQFRSDTQVGFAPIGPEQLVNEVTAGPQNPVSVAADVNGNYVAAWETLVPGVSDQYFARVFNADGTPKTGDLLVSNEPTPSTNRLPVKPEVAMADDGHFVVGWAGAAGPTVRVYSGDGTPRTSPIVAAANSSTVSDFFTDLAADPVGNFVVVYKERTLSRNWGWSTPTVKAQRFTAAGVANGSAIKVAALKLENGLATAAMSDTGSFVVAWDDVVSSGNVFAQRYTAAGKTSGQAIVVNADTSAVNSQSNVAMNGSGQFVVTWARQDVGGMARRYNANGTPVEAPTPVAAKGASPTGLGIDDAGTVVVAWTDSRQPAWLGNGGINYPTGEVRVERWLAGATVPAPETLANTTTQGVQASPALAVTGTGTFVAAWQGYGPGDDGGVFAQQFAAVGALTAAVGPATGPAAVITDAQLQPIVREAIRRWARAGLTAGERVLLHSAAVHVGDLDGATLGLTAGTAVTIDRDAAGYGWFVDRTPRSDSEFHRKGDQGEQGHMDLLTAVEHELGHVLGRDHSPDGVMSETLAVGTRESIVPGTHIGPIRHAAPAPRLRSFLSSGRR